MKIITVNLPLTYIKAINALTGNTPDKLYPSRSELCRVAVRDFVADRIKKLHEEKIRKELEEARQKEDPTLLVIAGYKDVHLKSRS